MKHFKLIDNVTGWLVFLVAAFTYLSTIEPTGSFWDCGEFVSSAFKLEVGHPPGAPFFMLMANLFTQLTSNTTQVAKMVNCMSALFSALTILFLFWSITHMARRIILKEGKRELTLARTVMVMGCNADNPPLKIKLIKVKAGRQSNWGLLTTIYHGRFGRPVR